MKDDTEKAVAIILDEKQNRNSKILIIKQLLVLCFRERRDTKLN